MLISNKTEVKLTLTNLVVFASVLITLSVCLFIAFSNKLELDTKSDLERLADAVIASIDFDEDEEKKPSSAEPDLVASEMPSESAPLLNALRLQWFNYEGKLASQKGSFEVNLPFEIKRESDFKVQKNPHGLLFTKPVFYHSQLLGYVRVARPLETNDRTMNSLVWGLLVGNLAALIVSGFGISFLVSQALAPVRLNMQKLRQFTSDASHELRNPIMSVITNSSVALKHADGMRQSDKEKFETIMHSGTRMQKLVENLLELNRAENSTASPSLAYLEAVLRDVKCDFQDKADEKNISLSIQSEADLKVAMSENDLRSVVSNILDNAIRYTSDGGNIEITVERVRDQVTLIVKDNGVGIATEDLGKIFDRFWRADKSRQNGSGHGIGLALVKELVETHGGKITVQSELGKGTSFAITLQATSTA